MEIGDVEWFSRFYRAMEFAVWIKCSEGFCGDLGEHSRSVSWHCGSWLLSNQWLKICGHLFLEDAAGGKDHSSTTVKKEEGKKSQTNPQRIFGFDVANQRGRSVSFVSLHLGSIKYITSLFLALFSKGVKKIQINHLI